MLQKLGGVEIPATLLFVPCVLTRDGGRDIMPSKIPGLRVSCECTVNAYNQKLVNKKSVDCGMRRRNDAQM